jgi:hypothetical protein
MRILCAYIQTAQQKSCAFIQMKKSADKSHRGGSREGAGRPTLGKTRINLTLNSNLVDQARAKEQNLSALLDRLLMQWLTTQNRTQS